MKSPHKDNIKTEKETEYFVEPQCIHTGHPLFPGYDPST